jgi:hypothetical protein
MSRVAKPTTPPEPAKQTDEAPAPPRESARLQGRLHLQFGPTASPPGSRLKKR